MKYARASDSGSLAPRGERVRVRDICAARLSDAPHILNSSPSGCTRLFKSVGYALYNGVDFRVNLVAPEPQHAVSGITEKLSSIFVARQFVCVLRTVDLDYQLCLRAKEICEEWAEGMLP